MADDTSKPGGNGVFVSSREIYDKLVSLEIKLATMPTKHDFDTLEDRVRKVELGVKAIPPALILVLITIVLAFINTK